MLTFPLTPVQPRRHLLCDSKDVSRFLGEEIKQGSDQTDLRLTWKTGEFEFGVIFEDFWR